MSDYSNITHNLHLSVSPREWQKIALERWEKEYRGVVSVVTGGGKTIFAHMCIASFLNKFSEGKIIIIVPTISLLDQWFVSLTEDFNASPQLIACYSGEERPSEPKTINLMVINTARKIAPKLCIGSDALLIVDECHRIASPVNALALSGEHRATLGLSATPEREYDDGFLSIIEPQLGKIIFEYDYISAYRDKVLSPFELINVKVSLLEHEQKEYDKLTQRIVLERKRMEKEGTPDVRLKILLQRRAAVSASARLRLSASLKIVDKHRGMRTIIFHERVSDAEYILEALINRKHSATIYHSGIGKAIRRDNLRLYRRGAYDVLLCCRALDEGINIPETQLAIIASSTASVRQRIQRLGRVLRPAPGKTAATVYTVYATDIEEERLIDEAKKLTEITSIAWQKLRIQHG